MSLAVGFHYLNGAEEPLIVYPAATFLDIGGVDAGMRSQIKVVRLFGRGPTDPAATAQKVISWAKQGALVQIANEPNLAIEGWTGQNSNDPALIERHTKWFLDVADRCGAVARTNLLYTPPSPGVPGWQAWLQETEAIAACHGLSAHVYGDLPQLQVDTWTYQEVAQQNNRPFYITEMNFGAGRTVDLSRWATHDMPQYLDWCAEAAPLCKSVTVFAWEWKTPDTPQGTSVSFKGTPVVTELARWVAAHPYAEEPVVPEKVKPWASKMITIWNLPPDPAQVITECQRLGFNGVEFKVADGDSAWGASRHVTADYVRALKAGGIQYVTGWGYHYCDGRVNAGDRGDGVPENEASIAASQVAELGLDGYTFDLEIECEGHGDFVQIALAQFRHALPDVPLAAHTWADLDGHGGYPADIIASHVDVIRPMCYRPVWNAAKMYADWTRFEKPIAPVWGITEGTPDDIQADQDLALSKGAEGWAYWEWVSRGRDDLVDVIRPNPWGAIAPEPPPVQQGAASEAVIAALDTLWAAAGPDVTKQLAIIEVKKAFGLQ